MDVVMRQRFISGYEKGTIEGIEIIGGDKDT
jgi:hypothetical protein